jgi:hypothetical protein
MLVKPKFIFIVTFSLLCFSSLSHGFGSLNHNFTYPNPLQSPDQSPSKQDKKSSLKSCEKLLKSIKNYDKMRRSGGTARQMAHWKKKRAEKQKLFFAQKCTEFRHLKL